MTRRAAVVLVSVLAVIAAITVLGTPTRAVAAPRTPGAASDRTILWLPAWQVVRLTDAELDEWARNGVGGFVMMTSWLPGLGGAQQFTADPNADLTGTRWDLQRTIKERNLAARMHGRGMRVYWGFYLANYNDSRAPLAGWFDDEAWANDVLPAMSATAGAARLLGFDGLAFDSEMYAGRSGSATWAWNAPGTTSTEAVVRSRARARGAQIMQTLLRAFPRVEFVVYGTYFREGWYERVQEVVNKDPAATRDWAQTDFWDGLTSVEGYGTITFLDATFYKSTHLSRTSWDTAFEYNAGRVAAFLSRSLSHWEYASRRIEIAPFVWVDAGKSSFERARPPSYVAEQLAAAHRWGGSVIGVYLQQPFPASFDASYVDGLRQAAQPGIVDATPPSLSIDGVDDRGAITISGVATDNYAVQAVHWRSASGLTGAAPMTWRQIGGSDQTGYDWRVDWTATLPAAARGQVVTVTASDIKGSTSTATIAIPGAPSAPPPRHVLAAVGSAATERVMDTVLGDAAQFNVHGKPSGNHVVPDDAFCGALSYGATAGAGVVVAPAASPSGRGALVGSVAGTYPDAARGAARGCVDIARSVESPAVSEPETLEHYAFALDAVMWATPSLKAPMAMTVQQLRDVYSCRYTDWAQVGGASGSIQRFLPPGDSDTRSTFITNVLGFDPAPVTRPGCPAVITDVEEDDGASLLNASAFGREHYQEAILPYSAGAFVFQATNSGNPTLDRRGGVRPGGLIPLPGAPAQFALRWAGSTWRLDDATVVAGQSVEDAVTVGGAGGSSSPPPSPIVISQSASFRAGDVGATASGTGIPPGAVIASVDSPTQVSLSVPVRSSATGGTFAWGTSPVSERNPNLQSPGDASVFPGVRYLSNVIDRTAPSYDAARSLVGIADVFGGAASPLCSGEHESVIASAGYLPLRPRLSSSANGSVTCVELRAR